MKSALYSLIALTIVTALFGALPVKAQESLMTDEHITRIKANCPQALATLVQTRINDAPSYINRNQQYFSISDKLMAHLNSRLALNRYDTTQLVGIASDYNSALTKFRAAYNLYDEMMADLVKMDCRKQPVEFYDRVTDAREQRQKVHDQVMQLNASADGYSDAVSSFQIKHVSQLAGNE